MANKTTKDWYRHLANIAKAWRRCVALLINFIFLLLKIMTTIVRMWHKKHKKVVLILQYRRIRGSVFIQWHNRNRIVERECFIRSAPVVGRRLTTVRQSVGHASVVFGDSSLNNSQVLVVNRSSAASVTTISFSVSLRPVPAPIQYSVLIFRKATCFCRAMLCISAAYAVGRCVSDFHMSSVCHLRVLSRSK